MRRILRLLAATTLALGLTAIAAVDARAGTTYTPAGGPSVRLVGTTFSITDVPAAQTFTCNSIEIAGQVVSPGTARAFGSPAVDLGALTYGLCSNPIYGRVELLADPAWTLDITGSATGSSWPAQLTNVAIRITAVGCVIEFSGAAPGTFNTATQRFTPTPAASTMTITLASGWNCVTLDFQVGDQMSFGGYFTNVPPTGSTALSLS